MINHLGRLYLTDKHVCFSSNLLGVKTKFVSQIPNYFIFFLEIEIRRSDNDTKKQSPRNI
jgi:hypothetical protein